MSVWKSFTLVKKKSLSSLKNKTDTIWTTSFYEGNNHRRKNAERKKILPAFFAIVTDTVPIQYMGYSWEGADYRRKHGRAVAGYRRKQVAEIIKSGTYLKCFLLIRLQHSVKFPGYQLQWLSKLLYRLPVTIIKTNVRLFNLPAECSMTVSCCSWGIQWCSLNSADRSSR